MAFDIKVGYVTAGSVACIAAILSASQNEWAVAIIFAAVGAYCLWRKLQTTQVR